MPTLTCPHCGELNEATTLHCAKCGSRLDAAPAPKPIPFGELLSENKKNLLWLGGGVVFLAMGLYAPWLGTAIIQTFLFFMGDSSSNRSTSSSTTSWCDSAIVIFFAVCCFAVGGVGLYSSLRKYWSKRMGMPEEPGDV